MASFDAETFLKVQGQTGTGPLQAIGMAYGMPSCMLNLAAGAMSLLPASILVGMSGKIAEAKDAASQKVKEIFEKMFTSLHLL